MIKHSRSQGFAHTFLVIGLIVALLGALGFIFWQNFIHKEPAKTEIITSTQPKMNDKYTGWKEGTLKYEKMSFKYPSTWQITETFDDEAATGGTTTPGADRVLLTSSTGLIVSILSGQAGVDSSGVTIGLPDSRPINTLGGNYFLVYYANKAQSTTDARGACLNKSSTSSRIPTLASRNIQMAGLTNNEVIPAANLICIGYQDEGGVTPVKPVSAFEKDASYKEAKLIIESLTY